MTALRTIEYLPVQSLRPVKVNPKRHSLAELTAGLARFGVVEAQVMDERTTRLVSGNGRLELYQQAEAAELSPPNGILADPVHGWLVPVVRGWRSRNNAELDAAVIAVNRLAERGGWHTADLIAMLDDVAATRAGLAGVGYAADDLAAMRATLTGKPALPAAPAPVGGTGVRSIVLDYPTADYDRLARSMQALRSALGVATNAELVARLVTDDAAAVGINI